ncbi:HIT-like domain-containing protein [Kockovaella imperatae]|uniref:HIT-like domain-containing protein n=1 Tax=Kockovaella imperatae TaxID=4999 RepID=A0A1Y1U983_9TREE|nr:HIT-like domain-containing protein [Kockovaella imperatae]ORX34104.1 HIT-like domain-containing protein [Kockovaella imperatae]
MPRWLSCFPSRPSQSLEIDTAGRLPGCVFCHVSVERGFAVVHEDECLIAFKDRSPQAETRLLIIPKTHIASSVRDLRSSHVQLVKGMVDLGHRLSPAEDSNMGFHIPPFSSVPHLHLHVMSGRRTTLGKLKYPVAQRNGGKGWPWFVTADQTLDILEQGGTIGVGKS